MALETATAPTTTGTAICFVEAFSVGDSVITDGAVDAKPDLHDPFVELSPVRWTSGRCRRGTCQL